MSQRELRHFKSFSKSLRSETDRACAVLAVTLLDSMLEKLLRKTMIKGADLQLFQPQGPLSSFSAKIELCFSMGLIAKDEYDELHLIRKIRNHFAHLVNHRLRFWSPVVRAKVFSLRWPRFFIGLAKELTDSKEYKKFRRNEMPRQRFELSFASVYFSLRRRIGLTKRVKQPKAFLEPLYHLI
jgi:hypothetical protein